MKKRYSAVLALVISMLMAFVGCSAAKTQTDASSREETSTEQTTQEQKDKENMHGVFGEFTSVGLDGKEVDQSIFEGKITMVSIWATISEHSVNQLADLEKISEEYADKGLQVVGVVSSVYINPDGSLSEDGVNKAQKAAEGISFVNILTNKELKAAKLDEARYIPETFFLDGDGNIIGSSYVGSKSYEDWCDIVDGVLESIK